jgi:ATP-dependent exoDNAse (exonuclease V) alpha subunit
MDLQMEPWEISVLSFNLWISGGRRHSRRQFPLRLACAVSIHKSQGMALAKAIVELGDKDFVRGLSFVAISRVRRITDLAFLS